MQPWFCVLGNNCDDVGGGFGVGFLSPPLTIVSGTASFQIAILLLPLPPN